MILCAIIHSIVWFGSFGQKWGGGGGGVQKVDYRSDHSQPTWTSPGSYNRRGLRQPLVSRGRWVWEGNFGVWGGGVWGGKPWRPGVGVPKGPLRGREEPQWGSLSLASRVSPLNSPCPLCQGWSTQTHPVPYHQGLIQTPCPQSSRHAPITRHSYQCAVCEHFSSFFKQFDLGVSRKNQGWVQNVL